MSFQIPALGVNPLAYEGVLAVNPANVVLALRAPTTSDTNYPDGTIWIDKSNLSAIAIYEKGATVAGAATWITLGSSSAAPGSFTTVTASGDITSTAGDLVLSGAGSQIQVEGGAVTDSIGSTTLALGTATVLNTSIAAGDRIIAFHIDPGLSTAIGTLSYTISAGVSFTINSLDAAAAVEAGDLSTVGYLIVRQL